MPVRNRRVFWVFRSFRRAGFSHNWGNNWWNSEKFASYAAVLFHIGDKPQQFRIRLRPPDFHACKSSLLIYHNINYVNFSSLLKAGGSQGPPALRRSIRCVRRTGPSDTRFTVQQMFFQSYLSSDKRLDTASFRFPHCCSKP